MAIDYWITINELMLVTSALSDYDLQKLRTIDNYMKNNSDLAELELYMVWAKAHQLSGNYKEALNVLNKVIAMFPAFLPGLSEKALILASLNHWDQALDTAQRALDTDSQYLDALKILVVHAFIKESHVDEALQKFEDYISALNARELASPLLYYETAQLVSRICNRQPRALQLCTQLLEQILPANPTATDAKFFSELGYIQTLRGQYDNAIRLYRDASKYDNMSFVALEGMILCQLLDKQTDNAEAQIELLSMMHSSDDDISAEFSYLQALLALQRQHDMSEHLNKLNECKTKYFRRFTDSLKHHTEPLHELILMNIDFLLQLAVSYLQHMESSTTIADLSSPTSAQAVAAGIEILEQILKVAPGISGIYVELSRVYAGSNKHDEACKYLRQSLSLLPSYAPAYIMLAKVESSRNNTQAAQRALEQALSCDFSIRSVPLFRLVSTVIKAQQTKYDEAISEIETIINAPEFKVDTRMSLDTMRLTDDDIVQAYILHATMLSKSGRIKESRKVLSTAKIQFAGTAQEVQVLIASSQLAVERNDYDTAIRMLDKITPSGSSSTYVKAQLIKADILLTHCRDKEGYTKCYQNLVDMDNENGGDSGKSYALLGDAYIKILNPEAAVSAYEKAYKYDPYNINLRIKIGKALTATHEYHRAIDFYEASLRELSQAQLPSSTLSYTVPISHDLCRIYLKLGRYEAAGRVLQQALHTDFSDISDMIDNVETLKMLYTVEVENTPETAIETLEKAKDLQRDVVSAVKSSSMSTLDSVTKQREKLSEIFCMLASAYSEHHGSDGLDGDTIEKYLTESLQHNPQNIKSMYQLARVRYSRNENEKCIIQCNKILTVAPDNEQAAIMLADVLAKDEKACEGPCLMPLKRLLERYPNNYLALERLLYYLRKLGMLEEAPKYIEYAEKNDCRYNSHAGYHFCKGLYSRYTNDVNKAILEFNYTRVDNGHWGTEGLAHMIELYLNPDQEGAWEEKEGESEMTNAGSENVKVAMALLHDLKPRAKYVCCCIASFVIVSRDHKRVTVLENYVLLATKQKSNIDKAMQSFIDMLEEDGDYLPAVLGMATGFMIEKTQVELFDHLNS